MVDMVNGSVRKRRDSASRVVFANGVFDLLHDGHVQLLKFAKSLGDYLVVGLNSDRSTKLLKGEERPYHTQEERKARLLQIDCVDEVVIFDDMRTTATILEIKPHVVVKGAEYTTDLVRSTDKIPDHIEIATCPILLDKNGTKISTTALLKQMKKKRR